MSWNNVMRVNTAQQLGLGACPNCHKLAPYNAEPIFCERCHTSFHQRKPNCITHSFIWLLASVVMFFPANLYPIMNFSTLGNDDASTILGGIIYLVDAGMLPIAIIIFIASFVVPLSKIFGIVILLYGVNKHSKLTPQQRTKLYRLIQFLGPWSMLDVFVVAIMAGVVQLGYITFIEPTAGVTYFALMVIFTMFSAESFDPRLLWDYQEHE